METIYGTATIPPYKKPKKSESSNRRDDHKLTIKHKSDTRTKKSTPIFGKKIGRRILERFGKNKKKQNKRKSKKATGGKLRLEPGINLHSRCQ